MPGNTFGDLFKITTFGESHGKAIGVVIDGCPSGLFLDVNFIQEALDQRRPGTNPFVSPREEKDLVEVISGVYGDRTTGAPITLMIKNRGFDSKPYTALENIYRPGHANFTYLEKFGIFDPNGGGRASARETASRVAAGAVASLILKEYGIEIKAYLTQVGPIKCEAYDLEDSKIFCSDSKKQKAILELLMELIEQGDSIGGIVTGIIKKLPIGLGEPVFDRFEAKLAQAMLSIPATKGFEIGEGFESVNRQGSNFNDPLILKENNIAFLTNNAGGTLGGITNGEDVIFKTVFKPTSSIKKKQTSVSFDKETVEFQLDQKAKHDPCVAIRGVPVVKAMAALVTCDFLLKARLDCLNEKPYSKNSSCFHVISSISNPRS
jgi:chorismate synthase